MTKHEGPVTVAHILRALAALGGEAQATKIKDQVTELLGGEPSHYKRSHSYRETIQRIIENHCPQSKNYKDSPLFERVSVGRYRLIHPVATARATG